MNPQQLSLRRFFCPKLGALMCVLLACTLCGLGSIRSITQAADPKPAAKTGGAKQPEKAGTEKTAKAGSEKHDPLVQKFFAQHCKACHTGAKVEGEFNLDSLSLDFSDKANRRRWMDVLEQVESGIMPPEKKPRPEPRDIKSLEDWVSRQVAAHSASQGRVVLRRLNRNEYANTIRDLLGVNVDLSDLLHRDAIAGGFDNSAEALHLSSPVLESYLESANRALNAAIANGPKPWVVNKRFDIKNESSVKAKGSVYRHLDEGVAIFSSWTSANIQVTLWQFGTRFPGAYRFRISGYGMQTPKPIVFHVMTGPLNAAAQQRLIDYYDVPADKPTVVEFVEQMEAQETIRIIADGLGATPPQVEKVGAENYKGPGLVVQWIEIEGPLMDAAWPPKSHKMLFGDLPLKPLAEDRNRFEVVSQQPEVDAERILRNFARRAFRRSVTDDDIKPYLDRVRAKLDQKYSFEQAVRVGLKGILTSPNFLFLRETPGAASAGGPAEPARGTTLDDFALASRLSYFLWSSMPDDELFALAEQRKLSQPETLRAQAERMLRDPKAQAFTKNFAGQWLGLRAIDDTTPDGMLYPEYDDVLKVSMVKEATLFFDEVLKNDLSLTNFVHSDFTIINDRLARHYGIPDVVGLEFRKVSLPPELHRGGVLTMAAVLKVTANGTTTSPITRGAWVLDRILGTPPPKPTVDVEAVDPDIRGTTTIRHQLAKHREVGSCASCHVKIDPPGFALESFDVIGGWREHYRSIGEGKPATVDGRRMRYLWGPAVDPADTFPDGRKFKNIDEFKQLLLADKDQVARALTEKLVAYGTGMAPTTGDQKEIESIVAAIRDKNYGLRTLVHEVVQSKVFRSK